MVEISVTGRDGRVGARVTQLVLGLALGALVFLVTSYMAAIPLVGSFQYRQLAMFAIALIAGACVLVGWRWPAPGLVAGIFNLALSLLVAVSGVSIWAPDTVDPFTALIYGAGTGIAAIVGVVLVCASLVARLPSGRR